jgi:hypothetical protein
LKDNDIQKPGRAQVLTLGNTMHEKFSRPMGTKEWSLEAIEPPWGDRRSIYQHVRAHIVDGQDGLAEGGDTLPDDVVRFGDNSVRWASGGLDGVFGHHGAGENASDAAGTAFEQLKAALAEPTQQNFDDLYETLTNASAINIADPLLERVVKDGTIDANRFRSLSVWLAMKAADREPVKLALAFLGLLHGRDDYDVILSLARHEEFTLYASVVVTNREENPDATLWQIAKHVDGWGRIQTVERLAGTDDPDIRGWLLREGYKNSVMYEYLAYTCATEGDLHSALCANEIDDALLKGAGDIIQTLIIGQDGPAAGIDDYDEASETTRLYLRHIDGRATTLDHFLALKNIEGYLADDATDWEDKQSMLSIAQRLTGDDKWRETVLEGLESGERLTFYPATEAARHLDIDTWDAYYRRTERGEDHWWELMQTDDPERAARVIELAESMIPLEEVAKGPSDGLGLGPEYTHHNALDYILQDLGRFPGMGWNLVQAGLRSPTIRNRNMAVRALDGWTQENWPDGAREAIQNARNNEPDSNLSESLEKLLNGQPLGF